MFRGAGLNARQRYGIATWWDGIVAVEYAPDLLVEDQIIIELKSVRVTDRVHTAQCLNDLKATNLKPCLLLNFGAPRLEIKRFAHNP